MGIGKGELATQWEARPCTTLKDAAAARWGLPGSLRLPPCPAADSPGRLTQGQVPNAEFAPWVRWLQVRRGGARQEAGRAHTDAAAGPGAAGRRLSARARHDLCQQRPGLLWGAWWLCSRPHLWLKLGKWGWTRDVSRFTVAPLVASHCCSLCCISLWLPLSRLTAPLGASHARAMPQRSIALSRGIWPIGAYSAPIAGSVLPPFSFPMQFISLTAHYSCIVSSREAQPRHRAWLFTPLPVLGFQLSKPCLWGPKCCLQVMTPWP